MAVAISSLLLHRLRALACAEPRVEVCGLLTGATRDRIGGILPAANVSADPATAFEIDPATLFAALRAERGGGPIILGHYHSHPSGDARPSRRDADASGTVGALWLVLGAEPRLWRAVPGGAICGAFDPVELRIAPDPIARNAASRHKGVEMGQRRGR